MCLKPQDRIKKKRMTFNLSVSSGQDELSVAVAFQTEACLDSL